MANSIKIHELAHEEYIDAYGGYEDKQTHLGERFMLEVEKALEQIVKYPLRYPKIKRSFRRAVVDGFPYVVIFEYYPRLKLIHVASIRHMKRKQRGQYRRKK